MSWAGIGHPPLTVHVPRCKSVFWPCGTRFCTAGVVHAFIATNQAMEKVHSTAVCHVRRKKLCIVFCLLPPDAARSLLVCTSAFSETGLLSVFEVSAADVFGSGGAGCCSLVSAPKDIARSAPDAARYDGRCFSVQQNFLIQLVPLQYFAQYIEANAAKSANSIRLSRRTDHGPGQQPHKQAHL